MSTQDDFGGRFSKFKKFGILINKHKTKSKRDYVNIFTREPEILVQTLQVLCETPGMCFVKIFDKFVAFIKESRF